MIIIIIVFAIIYCSAFLIGFSVTLRNPWQAHERTEQVSIVLCARNEERALPKTLAAFEAQEYPSELIEWILVDHNSSDNTNRLLQEFASKDPTCRRVIAAPDEVEGLLGKAAPWHLGMEAASNEIVLTTGADCFVPKQWIKHTVSLFDEKTQIVSGAALLVFTDRMNGLIARIQNLDMMMIQGFGYCLSVLGFGGAGLSNNYALRRSAYRKVGGFPKIGFSICEDVRLSQAILSEYGSNTIRYHLDRLSTPTTDPEPLKRIFNMKIRWAMGTRRLGTGGLTLIGIAFFAHLLLPLIAIFGDAEVTKAAICAIIAAWVATSIFIGGVAGRMKRLSDLIALPFFLPYLWIYTTVMVIPVAFRPPIRWKGLWVREPK